MEHEISTAWAEVGIGVGQLLLIAWGLRQMGKASEERTRKMDQQDEALRQQAQMVAELLRRSAQPLQAPQPGGVTPGPTVS